MFLFFLSNLKKIIIENFEGMLQYFIKTRYKIGVKSNVWLRATQKIYNSKFNTWARRFDSDFFRLKTVPDETTNLENEAVWKFSSTVVEF